MSISGGNAPIGSRSVSRRIRRRWFLQTQGGVRVRVCRGHRRSFFTGVRGGCHRRNTRRPEGRPSSVQTLDRPSFWCSNTRRTVLLVFEHQKDVLLVFKHQKDSPCGVRRRPEGPSFRCANTRRTVLLVFAHQKEFPYGVWDLGLRGFEWGTWI